jgi:acetyltransferase
MKPLQPFFAPRRVAVIGATDKPGSVGRAVVENLAGFSGELLLVNRRHSEVLGRPTLARIADLPPGTDLAIVVTPAPTVPEILRECTAAGIGAAVIISAGFKETGAEGQALEHELLAIARASGMRLIGPNCLGLMVPASGLNATFATAMARNGNIAFLSQSGALCTAILDWSFHAGLGFSAFVSVGSMLDVGWGDLLDHFADDPATSVIVLYMESVGDARSFLAAARRASARKPIVVLKAGRTEAAARAAASHTGALTGSDAVFDAALRRAGVLRVDSIAELFQTANLLATQPVPRGWRLAILTNAGGPGALAVDMLVRYGGMPAELAPVTLDALNAFLPAPWSHGNPVDILGDAGPERYARALEVLAADPGSDGLLVILTPQSMTDSLAVAGAVEQVAARLDKPLLASWMGGGGVEPARQRLVTAGIASYEYPDTAARIFARVASHLEWRRGLPDEARVSVGEAPDGARAEIVAARAQGRTLLTEDEAKRLLAACGLPVVPTRPAADADAAVREADALGYPVVLKLRSLTLTHKSDVGGVQLNLADADAVRRAFAEIQAAVTARAGVEHFAGVSVQPMVAADGWEIILGCSTDPQFGPVILFGAGGVLVHVLEDTALDLAPLTAEQARDLIGRTRIRRALAGARGQAPADLEALAALVAAFSAIPLQLPEIAEMDLNPLRVRADGCVVLDARVVLTKA